MRKRTLPLLLSLALTACAVGPDYSRPKFDLPASTTTQQASIASDWWQQFNDPVLDQLISEALQHNQDLALSAAQVDEAAALAGIARAQLLPSLAANAGYQRARTSAETTTPGSPLVADVRNANLTASWELDLWGKLRRSSEAARATLAASQYSRDAARLSLSALVAQTYFQMRAFDAQLDIAKRTLDSRESSLQLRQKRFKGGMTSELDMRQAESEAASARATIPQLSKSLQQTETALAVLLGRTPRELLEGKLQRGQAIDLLNVPPSIPADLSSGLLERRPDLAAAEAQLIAANARIGVAKAAYFPSISLTGALGSQSLSMETLFSGATRTWSFVGNATAPIFNFGQTGLNVDAASARQRQALAQYQKSVQTAFKETQDALVASSAAREVQEAQTTQLTALNRALHLATLRYDNGYSSYLDVLDAERNTFQAELNLVNAKLDRLNAAISLYKALGGGWENKTN
ncbi:efflux transporter outer membrane subunit [Aquitalea aquatica]|uniref:Efflux transporter outer membrane subunit n=1 Tax=Aquitalea aquatica TaxID=3044273 RepID=A0A838YA31_9NEIS|nr:efflux transporter outer membrane subunit [Aquitalea magnusonii]MBA4707634.1 efflux transporter outer membrane subunit [Aquitalea magnusonii]